MYQGLVLKPDKEHRLADQTHATRYGMPFLASKICYHEKAGRVLVHFDGNIKMMGKCVVTHPDSVMPKKCLIGICKSEIIRHLKITLLENFIHRVRHQITIWKIFSYPDEVVLCAIRDVILDPARKIGSKYNVKPVEVCKILADSWREAASIDCSKANVKSLNVSSSEVESLMLSHWKIKEFAITEPWKSERSDFV